MNHLQPFPDAPPKHGSVTGWLDSSFAAFAGSNAIVCNGQTLTYDALDHLSCRIASHLIEAGIKPGECVGICLDRSVEMVASMIGILKSGAAYVPMDPAYPSDRLAMMKEDARLSCILAHRMHAELFGADTPTVHIWEDMADTLSEKPSALPDIDVDPEHVAYVIFTSGSTGRPKGIAMPHRALSNLIEWQLERSSFKPEAKVLQYSSISFDVSFQEITTTLASGGTLYLITDEDRRDPRKLLGHLVENKIERLFLPYVAMRSLIETAHVQEGYPEDLKEVITAGEQLRVDDAVRTFFRKISGSTLDNQYGPSETHVITAELLEGDPAGWPDLPSIGTPLRNCGTCILDEGMQPVADGEEGELFLAGRNLAHGYIRQDTLTREVFIPSPFEVPDRPILYRTGDLASYRPDGRIEFLGRKDHQIKIRGHRIEPGEINNAASTFPGIAHCLTHAVMGTGSILQLAAYFTAQPDVAVNPVELRNHLAEKLPEYMLPSFLIELDEIPYTPSGKVDLKSLPRPSISNSQYADDETRYETDTEEALAVIWSGLLGLEAIPRNADFFELGGDSLRAVTLFLRIQQQLGRELPLSTLSHAPTIMQMAALIDGKEDGPDLSNYRSLKMIRRGDTTEIPLFLVHGGQGNVLVFNNFARMLDADQPVYAFQWSGWDGYRGETEIMQMAESYFKELQQFYPEGPIRLGGYCIGGLIVIELAGMLESAGRELVHPLIVWDSPNLESVHFRKDEPWDSAKTIVAFNCMKAGLNAIRIESSVDPDAAPTSDYQPPAGLGALIRRVPGLILLLRYLKQQKADLRIAPRRKAIRSALDRNEPVPMELRSTYCLDTMVKAVYAHKSSRYTGHILYFRSDCVVGRYFGLPGWWDDAFLGFAELCDGTFEAHAIGGAHTDVLDIPEMGELVNQSLAKAERV
jgi:amino acid adenylation domain-containing protein